MKNFYCSPNRKTEPVCINWFQQTTDNIYRRYTCNTYIPLNLFLNQLVQHHSTLTQTQRPSFMLVMHKYVQTFYAMLRLHVSLTTVAIFTFYGNYFTVIKDKRSYNTSVYSTMLIIYQIFFHIFQASPADKRIKINTSIMEVQCLKSI